MADTFAAREAPPAPRWQDTYERKLAKIRQDVGYEIAPEALVNLDEHLIHMWNYEPFYSKLSQFVRKRIDLSQPTAYITIDTTGEVVMAVNTIWLHGHTPAQIRGLIKHELNHWVLGHLAQKMLAPSVIAGKAMDLAINSLITDHPRSDGTFDLPPGGLIPGKHMVVTDPDLEAWLKEWRPLRWWALQGLSSHIAAMPKLQTSEWYFASLIAFAERLGAGLGSDDGDTDVVRGMKALGWYGDGAEGGDPTEFDDHTMWEETELDEETIKQLTARVIKKVDEQLRAAGSPGWGSLDALRNVILKHYEDLIDWTAVLANFIGTTQPGPTRRSLSKRDRRVPMAYPGMVRDYRASMAVFVDQSGSMSDDALALIAAELESGMASNVSFDMIPFDWHVNDAELIHWNRGDKIPLRRVLSGGTNFDSCIEWLDNPDRRREEHRDNVYEGALIITDGGSLEPRKVQSCRLAYIIIPGQKLAFDTQDLVIQMGNKSNAGRVAM
jgi:predicted metal-dependent peptidase